jgi:hypothetical protein
MNRAQFEQLLLRTEDAVRDRRQLAEEEARLARYRLQETLGHGDTLAAIHNAQRAIGKYLTGDR